MNMGAKTSWTAARRSLSTLTVDAICPIARSQRISSNDNEYADQRDRQAELRGDNLEQLIGSLRQVHELCDARADVATASLIQTWIGEAERRAWLLFENDAPLAGGDHDARIDAVEDRSGPSRDDPSDGGALARLRADRHGVTAARRDD